MAKNESTDRRVSPAFYTLRGAVIHLMAREKDTTTVEIAKRLGVNRSYVIRQTTLALKARTAAERRILKLAQEREGQIKRMGLGGLLGNEDVTTVLPGGERPKLGSLEARRAAKAKPATPKAKKESAPKPAPAKPAKVAKVKAPKPVKEPKTAKPAPEPAKAAKKAKKPKARKLSPAVPVEPLAAGTGVTAEDILGAPENQNDVDPAMPL